MRIGNAPADAAGGKGAEMGVGSAECGLEREVQAIETHRQRNDEPAGHLRLDTLHVAFTRTAVLAMLMRRIALALQHLVS